MKADYNAMEEFYKILNETVKDMLKQIENANSIVKKMNGSDHWDGNGYNYFKNKFDNISKNFGAYCDELYELNNTVAKAVKKYKDVEKLM